MGKFINQIRGGGSKNSNPLAISYWLAGQLSDNGAFIDQVKDLPLTVTFRFTMKSSAFKNSILPFLAQNHESVDKIQHRTGQILDSEQITGEIWQYTIEFIKVFYAEEIA